MLTFYRAMTSVIEIGRRSGAEVDPEDDDELESAMFRCAVVSRKHAKIAFTDAGKVRSYSLDASCVVSDTCVSQACLIDRNSHHGTHVRKAGETVSKMIKPETYTQLADGDMVTFGKAVGKGDDAVPPVTARVELHYAAEGETIKPLNVASTSSGHYGLHDPSSSSDESSGNIYSDVEEIPSPVVEKKQPSFSSSAASALNSVLKLTQRLPPLWLAGDNPIEHFVTLPTPRGYGEKERDEESVPSLHTGHFVESNEWDNAESSFHSSDEGSYSPRSRSNSPMELASPSPGPAQVEQIEPLQSTMDLISFPIPPPRPVLSWPPSSALRGPLPLPPPPPPPPHPMMPLFPPIPPMRMLPPSVPLPPSPVCGNGNVSSQFTTRLAPPPWMLQHKPADPLPAALLPERPVDHSPVNEAFSLHESDDEGEEGSVTSSHDAQMEDVNERLYALEVRISPPP